MLAVLTLVVPLVVLLTGVAMAVALDPGPAGRLRQHSRSRTSGPGRPLARALGRRR